MADETGASHQPSFSELTAALQRLEVDLLTIEQAVSSLVHNELHALAKSAIDEYRSIITALRDLKLK
ncbi:hypothetical protein [Bradyrhizobium guangzhouense]|uniref:Uncharacterized protein n=1 Tax=Bradyrhizobium guangzhouense TaxID=1325095 RepID=A0AAE5WWM1_9BRAD|nr:hypothetical protein [Bradyrhizobium guangzhouense]QAU44391.1 hypothetical protein XH91_02820 [Bradyrhizobium guangzhouense]RXH09303.1 hypothetical protein EAS54_33975 [Bradyrhizobium guangzhouense]RXH10038.1 hypothetical protein EAS56_24160 [Bradyrhizobium guangzhouense]